MKKYNRTSDFKKGVELWTVFPGVPGGKNKMQVRRISKRHSWMPSPAYNYILGEAEARAIGLGVGEYDLEHARRRNAAKARRRELCA